MKDGYSSLLGCVDYPRHPGMEGGWRKMALGPVLCLFIIAVIDAQLGWALSDISGFGHVVGIVCIAWLVYMVFTTPKTAALKK